MKSLRLSFDLVLPADAVTETFGVLAVRGAGKSNTAAVMAEEMHGAGLPFVVVDPVGCWWGLRSSRDGKTEGLRIPIFGGRRGDVPLERGGGQMIADLVVDQRLSCVLDLAGFDSEAAKKGFLLDFAQRLYQRNEAPLHLFLEEADDYIPQRPMRDEAQLLRAWENIVRRGRARGLGMTLITQRSASLNKNVLTQVQTLIAMRTTGPQDRAAIEDWLKYHHQGREILESLPGLKDGEGWVWSPRFLGKTLRTRFRLRETFDSAATPKVTAGARAPATLADVDLEGIRQRMAATIERAKANDPKELRHRIAELEKQAASRPAPVAPPKRIEVPVLNEKLAVRLEKAILEHARLQVRAIDASEQLQACVKNLQATILQARVPAVAARPQLAPVHLRPQPRPLPRDRATAESNGLGSGERRILIGIAQHEAGVTREQLSVLAGYKRSTRDLYIRLLGSRGLVDYQGDSIRATEAGLRTLGSDFEPLPSGHALREHWMSRLPSGERKVLATILAAWPEGIDREAISEATNYKRSTRDLYLRRLAARQLMVEVGQGKVRASETLFS